MKRLLTILICTLCSILCIPVLAQVLQPVKWSGEQVGDSVRLTATIEPGKRVVLSRSKLSATPGFPSYNVIYYTKNQKSEQ